MPFGSSLKIVGQPAKIREPQLRPDRHNRIQSLPEHLELPMRQRTLTLTLTAILAVTTLAAACGDDDSTEVGSGGGTEEPTTELPPDGGPFPNADLSFTVDLGDGSPISFGLTCVSDAIGSSGEDGSLDPVNACMSLTQAEVRDRLMTDQHLDRVCTEVYGGPEIAEITGTLDGTDVDTTITRNNGCGIDDWDRLLVDLLPPAAS